MRSWPSGTSGNVKMWLDIYVEGWEPYRMQHHCQVKKTKHPWPGQTLPVVVDRENRERIDIQWEEVETVDEQMAAGSPSAAPGVEIGEAQTIDITGTAMGEQIMQALQQHGLMPQQPSGPAQRGGGDASSSSSGSPGCATPARSRTRSSRPRRRACSAAARPRP